MHFKKVTCYALLLPAILTTLAIVSGAAARAQTPQALTDGEQVTRMKEASRQMSTF